MTDRTRAQREHEERYGPSNKDRFEYSDETPVTIISRGDGSDPGPLNDEMQARAKAAAEKKYGKK